MSRVKVRNSEDLALDTTLREINRKFDSILQWASASSSRGAASGAREEEVFEIQSSGDHGPMSFGVLEQVDMVLLPECVVIMGKLSDVGAAEGMIARVKDGYFTAIAWSSRDIRH